MDASGIIDALATKWGPIVAILWWILTQSRRQADRLTEQLHASQEARVADARDFGASLIEEARRAGSDRERIHAAIKALDHVVREHFLAPAPTPAAGGTSALVAVVRPEERRPDRMNTEQQERQRSQPWRTPRP